MDLSRRLASDGEPHGTVITADFQEAGRGRGQDRSWQMNRNENLPFTLLLRYPHSGDIPSALTLRIGLAVSLAVEDFAPSLRGLVMVKWPNDILIGEKKAVGILCEADGGNVHAGIGINVAQKEFPPHLREKATSIALAAGMNIAPDDRFLLLEKILICLFNELEDAKAGESWKNRLEQRLYKNGEQVTFIEGAAGSGMEVKGRLAGIGESGELLITPEGETQSRAFVTGELAPVIGSAERLLHSPFRAKLST
jgi:BirA family biotin operon repressor/biotin-[acetyl-CoA-carboxylase] ligase